MSSMEPEVREFLKKIVLSVFVGLGWLTLNMTLGIYFNLLFIENKFAIGNLIFYIIFIASFRSENRIICFCRIGLADTQYDFGDLFQSSFYREQICDWKFDLLHYFHCQFLSDDLVLLPDLEKEISAWMIRFSARMIGNDHPLAFDLSKQQGINSADVSRSSFQKPSSDNKIIFLRDLLHS